MVILIMYDFVYSDDIPIVGGHHRSKHRRGYRLHSIHVATSKQDIVIERSVDNFDVNENSFTPEFNGDILEEPFRR